MDFLDNLVLPQSGSNLMVLQYLLFMAKVIFHVYSGVLLGSLLFSVIFNFIGRRKISKLYLKISADFIDLITTTKFFAFGLGIVPFIGIIALYTVLLHGMKVPAVGYFILSFAFYLVSIFFVYAYKHSLHLNSIFSSLSHSFTVAEKDDTIHDYLNYQNAANKLNVRTGIFGLIFLFISLRIFISAYEIAVDAHTFHSEGFFFDIIFTLHPIIKFLHFFTASLALTGAAFIVKIFFWDKSDNPQDEEYIKFSQKFNIAIALIFTLVQPVFLVINLLIIPQETLSYQYFGLIVLILFFVFLVTHYLYLNYRESKTNYITFSFYLLLIIFSFTIIQDQTAFSITNRQNIVDMADKFEKLQEKLLEESGKAAVKINGGEIYETKCTACHLFDVKKVGPPHIDVLPKYINNKAALVKFLLNPVKVNPEYPAMTNPGLKPREADAIADYIINELGKKLK